MIRFLFSFYFLLPGLHSLLKAQENQTLTWEACIERYKALDAAYPIAQLAEAGIQTSMHYPAVHHFSIYQEFASELPVTDFLVDHLITLPMYSKLTVEQVNYISETLKNLL